jgi:hypothetical protein
VIRLSHGIRQRVCLRQIGRFLQQLKQARTVGLVGIFGSAQLHPSEKQE